MRGGKRETTKMTTQNDNITNHSDQPDGFQQDIDEEDVALRRDVAFGQKDLVVTAFHQVLLHRDGMLQVDVALDLVHGKKLQLSVKFRQSVIGGG